ncbi:MAG: hypothetical protein U1A77_23730 [Pirellulales bacterium]
MCHRDRREHLVTRLIALTFCILLSAGSVDSLRADTLAFDLGGADFTKDGGPKIESNAITIKLSDVAANVVRFELSFKSAILDSASFINKLSLNIADSFQANKKSDLGLKYLSSSVADLTDFDFQTPESDSKLSMDDSDGWDLIFTFSSSGAKDGVRQLRNGETIAFDLTAKGLDIADFKYLNAGGSTLAHAAVQISGSKLPSGSFWYSDAGPYVVPSNTVSSGTTTSGTNGNAPAPEPAPEPATLAIWSGLALAAMASRQRVFTKWLPKLRT